MPVRYKRNARILALARKLGIKDPRAALAVASAEGLAGGIGDSGTSFGPWQLHRGGALPKGIANPHQWAWSDAGLLYALSQIKKVAGNRVGQDAISAIVNRFERPAAPGAEIQRALNYYRRAGGSVSGASPQMVQTPALGIGASPAGDPRIALMTALGEGQSFYQALPAYEAAKRLAASAPRMPLNGHLSPSQPLGGGNRAIPAELFYDPLGGIKFGKQIGAIGGHSDHVHVAYTNPQAVLRAIALARRKGLRVGSNPYVTGHPEKGGHVKDSFHYRQFPGLFHGRHLSEAIDVSGPARLMAEYYRLLAGMG
jgi:hypothetical protein